MKTFEDLLSSDIAFSIFDFLKLNVIRECMLVSKALRARLRKGYFIKNVRLKKDKRSGNLYSVNTGSFVLRTTEFIQLCEQMNFSGVQKVKLFISDETLKELGNATCMAAMFPKNSRKLRCRLVVSKKFVYTASEHKKYFDVLMGHIRACQRIEHLELKNFPTNYTLFLTGNMRSLKLDFRATDACPIVWDGAYTEPLRTLSVGGRQWTTERLAIVELQDLRKLTLINLKITTCFARSFLSQLPTVCRAIETNEECDTGMLSKLFDRFEEIVLTREVMRLPNFKASWVVKQLQLDLVADVSASDVQNIFNNLPRVWSLSLFLTQACFEFEWWKHVKHRSWKELRYLELCIEFENEMGADLLVVLFSEPEFTASAIHEIVIDTDYTTDALIEYLGEMVDFKVSRARKSE